MIFTFKYVNIIFLVLKNVDYYNFLQYNEMDFRNIRYIYMLYNDNNDNKDENEYSVKHTKIFLVFIILLAIVMGIIFSSIIVFYHNEQKADIIQSGIYIKGINVSGLTRDEAIVLVKSTLNDKMNSHIELLYKNNNYYLEIEQFGAFFDVESAVDYAFSFAKSGNFIEDMHEYISILINNIDIEPKLIYNDTALTEYLETIEIYLPDQLEQPDYYIEDDKLYITNGKIGAGIEYDKLKKEIISSVQDISYTKKYIEIPTYDKVPDEINVDKIHDEVYREVKNAYFTTEPYAVFADVTGIDFNVDMLKDKIINNPNDEEYEQDLIYTKADVTVNDLGKEAFPDLLATFSTNYVTSNTDRTTNLRLAAGKINGTVVMPGEIFSYNKVVGKRTVSAGYKEAAVYQDGGVTNGLGGGICQISTTLYNAVIKANMEIETRRNHMFVPSYIGAGKDATVVWGSTDFKFKNRRDYPIKIETSVSGGVARVDIYGLRTNNEYDISLETKTIKSSSTSLVVESYRVTRLNGEIIKKEKLYTDTYKKGH